MDGYEGRGSENDSSKLQHLKPFGSAPTVRVLRDQMEMSGWEMWVGEAIGKLESQKVLRSLRPIHQRTSISNPCEQFRVFDCPNKWDRASVEVHISQITFQKWLHDLPSSGDDNDGVHETMSADNEVEPSDIELKKLVIFSGNDYIGLSSHPMVRDAAIKAAQEHGMGPRGSALICGYTSYHRVLESSLARLKRKEASLPTWP